MQHACLCATPPKVRGALARVEVEPAVCTLTSRDGSYALVQWCEYQVYVAVMGSEFQVLSDYDEPTWTVTAFLPISNFAVI